MLHRRNRKLSLHVYCRQYDSSIHIERNFHREACTQHKTIPSWVCEHFCFGETGWEEKNNSTPILKILQFNKSLLYRSLHILECAFFVSVNVIECGAVIAEIERHAPAMTGILLVVQLVLELPHFSADIQTDIFEANISCRNDPTGNRDMKESLMGKTHHEQHSSSRSCIRFHVHRTYSESSGIGSADARYPETSKSVPKNPIYAP